MGQRILLVDDEPRNLAVLKRHLGPQGYDLSCASDGYEALKVFETSAPDLVLLDYVMPGLDGLDVLAHIRASVCGAHTPVVLVTAYPDREHRLRGAAAGADDFLEKPIDDAILTARVKNLLSLKNSLDALHASRDELAQRNAALHEAQREHRELMSFIVHDLKAPLAVIHFAIEWLSENVPDQRGEIAEAMKDAAAASTRLNTMTFDLLAVSQLEQPTLQLQCERIDLGTFLPDVAHSYHRRAHDNDVSVETPALAGDLCVSADRALLRRVTENILENAFRHTPRGGPVALVARRGEGVEIVISNDGPPIPPGDRARIFEKFQRGTNEARRRGNAGLGLYFCKRAVEAHGGAIAVVQTSEWPTSFLIRLPAGAIL